MNLFTLPLRNLTAQKVRTILTVFGIAVAVAGFIALTGLTRGLQDSYEHGIGEAGGDVIVSQRGTYSLVSSSLTEDLTKGLTAVAGVEEAAGMLLTITEVDSEANIFIAGWPSESFLWQSLNLTSGVKPDGLRDVVLGRTVAEALGKKVGDDILIQYETYKISGISESTSVFNQNIAIVTLPSLQALTGRPNSVSLYQIRMKRPVEAAEVEEIKGRLAKVSDGLAISDSAEFAKNLQFVKTVEAVAFAVSLVMMLASSLMVANTLLMSIYERSHEFGILAAIGWTPTRIRLLVVAEGFIMCMVGSVIGVGLGVLAMYAVSWMRITAGLLEPFLTVELVLQAVGFVAILGPVAALYPAWRATRATPSAAIRGMR